MSEAAASKQAPLLKVEHLKQYFPISRKFTVKAVDDVSFDIFPGETYGLVGESGSGKSTIGRAVIRLYDPTAGKIIFDGEDISGKMSAETTRHLRTNMQMIFQDPMACLNPRKKVVDIIAQGLDIHKMYSSFDEREEKVAKILEKVGLAPEHATRFPHQFSGGQRQRIGIARALSLNPAFIVADEPVSALDVSIQAQIINLLAQLQRELELTVLFISHDLRVVRHITHRVMVMYLGSNVEVGPTEAIFQHPAHPYTQVLTKAAPKLDPLNRQRDYAIEGEPPSPIHTPTGCKFHPRCPYCTDKCRSEVPELKEIAPGHLCACHYPL